MNFSRSAGGPAVVDPGLLDLDVAQAGLDGPLGEMAVADDLASPGLVLEVGVGVDPGGDLGLDGLGQQPPGPVPEEVGQDVLGAGRWPGDRQGSRLIHGGVLLGHFGRLVVLRFTKGTPPKSNRHPQLPVIARNNPRHPSHSRVSLVPPPSPSFAQIGRVDGCATPRMQTNVPPSRPEPESRP